jgi:aldose 1-epimerase
MVSYLQPADGARTNNCEGSLPIKSTQGLDNRRRTVEQYGCVVMEVQDYIDAINRPEWQREKRQIFGPNDPAYTLEADYVFSTTS